MLTQERLKDLLEYNPDTGDFFWKINKNSCKKGTIAGGFQSHKGYKKIGIDNYRYYSHRLAWLYIYGVIPKESIDHIDGNKSNNSILNLRLCTQSENLQNIKECKSFNKTGRLGVSFSNRKAKPYTSAIQINNKKIYIGIFASLEEASEAYLNAKRKYHKFNTL